MRNLSLNCQTLMFKQKKKCIYIFCKLKIRKCQVSTDTYLKENQVIFENDIVSTYC